HENGACDHEGQCVLLAVWAEVGATMRDHLQSFTLADMVERSRGNRSAGRSLGTEPSFAGGGQPRGGRRDEVLESLIGSGS
ncbi:MAG TPA: hypothetical protein VMD28_06295, partial [Acidimicrobiales bacterium]|nr:hypothetical protein [Acidimicrobiales bacterium]